MARSRLNEADVMRSLDEMWEAVMSIDPKDDPEEQAKADARRVEGYLRFRLAAQKRYDASAKYRALCRRLIGEVRTEREKAATLRDAFDQMEGPRT